MASGVGTKSRAPPSTSSINFGICCVMSNDDVNIDGIPVVFNVLYVGSVIILVNESRIGCGIVTSDGVINVSLRLVGMNGVGVDRNRFSNASSDGTLPVICCCYRGRESINVYDMQYRRF